MELRKKKSGVRKNIEMFLGFHSNQGRPACRAPTFAPLKLCLSLDLYNLLAFTKLPMGPFLTSESY